MSELTHPHDHFFRRTFSRRETAIDFVRNYVPAEVVDRLALESLEVTTDSFVDGSLRGHLADVVCRVGLRGGGDALVYVLLEHKSVPEPLVALQLLRYIGQLWEGHLREGGGVPLPAVLPLVLYHHGPEPSRGREHPRRSASPGCAARPAAHLRPQADRACAAGAGGPSVGR